MLLFGAVLLLMATSDNREGLVNDYTPTKGTRTALPGAAYGHRLAPKHE